ncbi:MAG: HlyD family efflux transporter periplasmic adaptor subunit [Acidobacteria bacterium]|nr:HlyD family efflux transporter periplasmic adaptor subunit [Acidobacteriota bacterium]
MTKPKQFFRLLAIFIVLLSITIFAGGFFLNKPIDQNNIIMVSGRIESDDATIAAKTTGRIREITVREGDQVKAGQLIAMLDDEQLKAREQQAQSMVDQAQAKVLQAQQQIAVLQAELQQSRLGVSQAKLDAEGRISQAQSLVAAAEANLAQAKAAYQQALYDEEKFSALVASGDMPAREGRQARTATETQKAVVDAASKQVEAAKGALLAAQANLDNPTIRAAQASAIEQQIRQAQTSIQSAQAEAARAQAQLQEAQANRKDLEIFAPFDGTVATRMAEPGEVLAIGAPIISLVNFNAVYLRGFIPEGEIGRVRNGQPARVYLDSNPNQALEATVSRIDPQASFTPENTYFRDDRVKQVVGVKLQLINPQGFAKPGMPADGEVLVEGNQWISIKK